MASRKIFKAGQPRLPRHFSEHKAFDGHTGIITPEYIEAMLKDIKKPETGKPLGKGEAWAILKKGYNEYLEEAIPNLHKADVTTMIMGPKELRLLLDRQLITIPQLSTITAISKRVLEKYLTGERFISFTHQMLLYYIYKEPRNRIAYWLYYVNHIERKTRKLHFNYFHYRNYIPAHLNPKTINAILDYIETLSQNVFFKELATSKNIPKALIPYLLHHWFLRRYFGK